MAVQSCGSNIPNKNQGWRTGFLNAEVKWLEKRFRQDAMKSSPRLMHTCALLSRFSHVQLFATPGTVAYQALMSMGFSRQEYWSGLPFLLQGIFPNQWLNPSPALQRDSLPLSCQGSPDITHMLYLKNDTDELNYKTERVTGIKKNLGGSEEKG